MQRSRAMHLRPFFSFYGAKWRAAPKYPAPDHETIVEPFSGAAGYSTRHHERKVILVEKDPIIAGLWRYLIGASADEIRALPLEIPTTVRDLGLAPGPSALIGFYCNNGASAPMQSPSAWMREGKNRGGFWGAEVRERIATQVGAIRHWTIIEGDFAEAPDVEATWYVDPPYAGAGKHYRVKFNDFERLAAWCKTRRGQVMVCENVGATWLPFEPFAVIKANESRVGGKRSAEALWQATF